MNPKPQKSRFALPVAFTAALHAFFFFGFSPVPPIRPPVTKPVSDPAPRNVPVVLEANSADITDDNSAPLLRPVLHTSDVRPDSSPILDATRLAPAIDSVGTPPGSISVPSHFDGPMGPFGNQVGPIDLGRLDEQPKATFQIPPQYPASLRDSGLTGEVLVEFVVDRTGHVAQASVVSATHPGFEHATLQAVLKWRFEPGRHHGIPVSFRMTIPVRFEIER